MIKIKWQHKGGDTYPAFQNHEASPFAAAKLRDEWHAVHILSGQHLRSIMPAWAVDRETVLVWLDAMEQDCFDTVMGFHCEAPSSQAIETIRNWANAT